MPFRFLARNVSSSSGIGTGYFDSRGSRRPPDRSNVVDITAEFVCEISSMTNRESGSRNQADAGCDDRQMEASERSVVDAVPPHCTDAKKGDPK